MGSGYKYGGLEGVMLRDGHRIKIANVVGDVKRNGSV